MKKIIFSLLSFLTLSVSVSSFGQLIGVNPFVSPTLSTVNPVQNFAIIAPILKVVGQQLSSPSVPFGATNIDINQFVTKVSQPMIVGNMTFNGNISFNSTYISRLHLRYFKPSTNSWVLVTSIPGSQISNNQITINSIGVDLTTQENTTFLLKADITPNTSLPSTTISAQLTNITAITQQGITINGLGVPASSNNTITIQQIATVYINVNKTHPMTNRSIHLLGGTEKVIGAFDLTVLNNDVNIKDIIIHVSGLGSLNFSDSLTEFSLYDENFNQLAISSQFSGTEVLFNNINFYVPIGTTRLFLKATADSIGSYVNGNVLPETTVSFSAENIESLGSSTQIIPTYDSGGTKTNPTFSFDVVPVLIKNIGFTQNHGGYSLSNQVTNGNGQNIAILTISLENRNNTHSITNELLKAAIESTVLTIQGDSSVISNVKLKRIDIANGPTINGTMLGNQVQFDMSELSSAQFGEAGSTMVFLIKSDISGIYGPSFIRVDINNLNGGNITYGSSDPFYGVINALLLPYESINGVTINLIN